MLLIKNDCWAQEISWNFKANLKNRKFIANPDGKNGGNFWRILRNLGNLPNFNNLIFFRHSKKCCLPKIKPKKNISFAKYSTICIFLTIEICMKVPALQVCFRISWDFYSSSVIFHQQHLHRLRVSQKSFKF
jgi:hypothetical protein